MVASLGNLGTALRTAQSGLWTSQQVLDVVANNVANVNTAGYSRKEAQLNPVTLAGSGVGVEMTGISRTVDQGLLATLRRESGTLSATDIAASFESRLQDVFGTTDSDSSIAHLLTSLQTAIQSVAASPDGSLAASDAVRWAQSVSTSLNEMSSTVQQLRQDADKRLADGVREASGLLTSIADLNGRIVHDTQAGRDTTGLADERDKAADRLAELLDVRMMTREQGDMVVFTAAGRTLVDGTAVSLSHTAAANVDAQSTYAEGDFSGVFVDASGATTDITSALGKGGELGQLVTLRDQTLPDVQSTLDALATSLRDTLNQAHNRGVAIPGLSQATGSRVFADPATQTMSLTEGDTVIALFDSGGTSQATTTLSTLMGGGSGPWTISAVSGALDGWLKANVSGEAGCDISDGRLTIDLATSTMGLAFRDQVSGTPGAERADAQIAFSADGGAGADEQVAGFSSFFGLNDLFVDKAPEGIYESQVTSAGWRSSSTATIDFRNSAGPVGTSVTIPAGSDMNAIADAITAATGLRASVVPDGNGARLRIVSADGSPLAITESTGSLIEQLDLGEATTGVAQSLAVRSDIAADPSKLTRGIVQWDAGLGTAGSYFLGRGDGTAVAELSEAMNGATGFATAGTLASTSETLAAYAGRILGESASRAAVVENQQAYQTDFVATLKAKSDSIRGVNIDQELSDLMLYEQAYSASARVITVIQRMYEALDQAV